MQICSRKAESLNLVPEWKKYYVSEDIRAMIMGEKINSGNLTESRRAPDGNRNGKLLNSDKI